MDMTRKIATLSGILIGITLVSTLFPAYSRASSPATAKRAAAAHQGNIPNPLPSGTEGPIESAEVENKIYDPNNPNLVVATEWLKLQYEVDYQWVDSGVTTGVSDRSTVWLECANVCLSKKHKS